MIKLKSINKTYKGFAGNVSALNNVSLHIKKGERVAIVGKSGSGKSTLLNIISGVDRPDSGELHINDKDVKILSENALANWRGRTVGVVFQSYQLLPTLSAIDNVLFAMDLVNVIPKSSRHTRAKELLDRVELSHKLKKFPNELSGGEVQRVAIARALANDPPIIIADEPTGNLDSKTSEQIYSLFQSLSDMGKNLVIVTHEDISTRNFNRVLHMKDGHLLDGEEVTVSKP